MKPRGPGENRFPAPESFFRGGMGDWRGFWPASDDGGESDRRRFNNFTRDFLLESARERMKGMIVFGLVVTASAWPVGYMVVSVIKLLLKGHPLDR